MSSSMLAGERRWASARRGGMTVLGKVAVPKPLNLPSQRLENHGLDPNVEIVPKGSLSWGSRSSASNPWGSSVVSPNADGSVSPSHLIGRPSSSGGSGTRPSTAGSDRMHEAGSSAWGPNSRPSSASGPLTSNQTSLASSRPRSAETRPGSSQLSRFAEPVSDNSVAWGSTGTMEKLVLNSKSDNFSLSSGDFPTLGKNPESEDNHSHGRPGSSSGKVASPKERAHTDVKGGTINTWTRDGAHHVEDGVHSSTEKWHGDHPQYLNPNIPPQHFDWRGPPMNAPAGVWYRGPPGGPPYPPVAHGGFPIEPFPYYHPQIPPALANPQPVPPRGPGPRGHHPKNGDFYRPQMPDAFIRPGMPMRPGFYPGPVPYDGYYGPPMGYNPNERDIPFMGMPAGPPVYNMYPPQNSSEPGDIQARAGSRGSGGKRLVTEHSELSHSDNAQGPYKVLKKRQNEWGLEEEEANMDPTASTNALYLEKGEQSRTASLKNEWGADNRSKGELDSRRATLGENHSSRTSLGHQGHSSETVILKSPRSKSKAVDESWGKKSEIATPLVEVPQELPAALKDTTLIQKIESLNAKVREFGGREDVEPSSLREDQKNRVQLVNTKANHHSMNEASSTQISGDSISSSQEVGEGFTGEATRQATADNVPAFSRRAHPGVHGRVDNQNKGRFNNHDSDGWRKKSPSLVSESSAAVPAVYVDHTSSFHAQDHHVTVEAADKSEISIPGKNEEESFTPMFDPTDGQAQRAKMRELAKQRAIQLQKEEEERIKEQKAKALAKLEELNRRTLAGDSLTQKLETPLSSGASQHDSEELQKHPCPVIDADKHVTENLEKPLTSAATQQEPEESQKHLGPVIHADKHAAQKLGKSLPSGAIQRNPKESRKQPGPVMIVDKCELPSSISTSDARVVAQTSEKSISGYVEDSVLSKDSQFEGPKSTQQEPFVLHGQSLPSKLDVVNTGAEDRAANDVSLRRHKRNKQKQSIQVDSTVSDKPKQSIQVETTVTDKSTPISSGEPLKGPDIGASEVVTSQVNMTCVPSLPNNSNIMSESVGYNRRKNRSSRNKHKLDEVASCAASQSPATKETHPTKASSAFATSQSPVTKESLSAKPSGDAASPSAVSKETLPANASASVASQSPVKKEILTVKASATAASQSLVQAETLPANASASAPSQLVLKETHPAMASLSASSQAPVPKETLSAKALPGRGQPKASELELYPNSVQLVTDVKDANQQSGLEQSSSLPSEEADSRVNSQWKPQNSRRVSRNPQALRSGDKFHGTESVVWAPVRSQNKQEHEGEASQKAVPSENKLEPEGEASQKAVQSQNKLEPEGDVSQRVVPDVAPPTRSNNPVQTSMKSKRAEMERYVPKAVAKELAQQGSIQQPVALSSSVHTLDEISEREGPGSQSVKAETGNVGSSLEPRNGNFKQSKQQARTQGSWRPRGSSEAQHGQGFQQGSSFTSNPSKNVKKSMDQQDTPKPDLNFLPAENKVSHDWDPSDGWNMPEEPIAAASVTYMVKDEGKGAGKGMRHPHKGHRSTMNSHDLDHRSSSSGGEADKSYTQFTAPETSQTDRVVSFKESRASHWQPKSQVYAANNQRGSRSGEGQNDSSEVTKNSPPQGRVQTTPHDIKESSEITHQPPLDQSVSENKNVGEASNVGHEEARRERGPAASRRRPRTPNQSLGTPDNMDEQAADQHYSSASRRSGIQNNRSGRGNESRRDWSSGGQDNRPQHVAPSRERLRQNSHFEYQPIGSHSNNGKLNNFDGPTDGSRNMGSRYRERGSGRPRGGRGTGNFHGQVSESIRVEAGND